MKPRHLSPRAVAACTAAALLLAPNVAHAAHAPGGSIGTGPDAALAVSVPDAVPTAAALTPNAASTLLGTPSLHDLAITGSVEDLAVVGDKVWISSGNEVDVYSTAGKKLATFSGVLGAAGIIASTDQSRVYVAASQDSKIITYDAVALTQTTSWTASPCPTDLAIAAGRLFYSFGCQIPQASIGSLSVSDGSQGPVIAEHLYQPDRLVGAGQSVISMSEGGSPNDVTSFLIGSDGTATTQGTMRTGEGYDLAVSPDGSKLIVTGYDDGYTIERFNTVDLSVAGTFDMGPYPKAVAYAPDGAGFAGALSTNSGELLRVFDDTAGNLISHSGVPTGGTEFGGTTPDIVPGTLHYSADGARLYGIVTGNGITALVTATSGPVTASTMTASVASPAAYGKAMVVRISAPGRPKAKIVVTVPITGNSTRQATGTTDARGNAVIRVTPVLSGKVTIALAGDLSHAPKTVTKAIKVPARLSATPTGYYSTSGGILHYRSIKAVHVVTRALPKRTFELKAALQVRVDGHWRSGPGITFTTAADGSGYAYLKVGQKHFRYRLELSFAGDAQNSKAPSVISKAFIVD